MIDMLLKSYQTKLDARFDILLAENSQSYIKVIEAARYSLINGGKRIRPVLLLEFYKLCGADDDCAYNFACAIEMIHTYSLIHDDLPCMDNDDMRRGKPSCHKKFSEDVALLAGDALLTQAFETCAKTMGIDHSRVLEALSYLAHCAGIDGMIGGQVMDISKDIPKDDSYINQMYLLKTAALIKASCRCGAILAGADDEKKNAAEEYGEKLGIAFQLIDDILDFQGDEALLGKPTGSDEKNGKTTLATVIGIETSKRLAEDLTLQALEILNRFEGDKTNLVELTKYLLSRKF